MYLGFGKSNYFHLLVIHLDDFVAEFDVSGEMTLLFPNENVTIQPIYANVFI